jgi:hypothetical protein
MSGRVQPVTRLPHALATKESLVAFQRNILVKNTLAQSAARKTGSGCR